MHLITRKIFINMTCRRFFNNRYALHIVFAISTILLLYSCTDNQLVKSIQQFKGQQITIPADLHTVWKGRDTLLSGFTQVPVKFVVWVDSLNCASCKVNSMREWNDVVKYADSLAQWFNIIFLFTPKKKDLNKVNTALRANRFDYPIFIDRNADFVKQNPRLPKQQQLHIFLLDKDNRVILVGNPLRNPTLWVLYQRTIQTMIENDGVLPKGK